MATDAVSHDPSELRARLDWLARDESGSALQARCFVRPLQLGVPLLDRFAVLRPCDVAEASGGSGCGKTQLLVAAAAGCVLPDAAGGVRFGGDGSRCLFLDLARSVEGLCCVCVF